MRPFETSREPVPVSADGRPVCDSCLLATSVLRRLRGLMGRASLPVGEGVLIWPSNAVHTAFMRFPIDVVFVDRDLRVLRVVPALPPWRAAARRGARGVLELPAGQARARGLGEGQRLVVGRGRDS